MGLEFEYRNQRDTLTTHHVRRAGSITYPYITLLSTVYPFDRPVRRFLRGGGRLLLEDRLGVTLTFDYGLEGPVKASKKWTGRH
ncbi:hypothetical protein NC652_030928 [Populus alba x Populus x berolinensis]|nr:hypothetical protein NC652_030928 [Populus alba x Populus x berolinensis]